VTHTWEQDTSGEMSWEEVDGEHSTSIGGGYGYDDSGELTIEVAPGVVRNAFPEDDNESHA